MGFYCEEEDGYEMDEEDREVMRKAVRKEKMFDGRQWVFCFS